MSNLWIQETFVNETRNCIFGESEWYETFTDKVGVLFRDLSKEYGRCTSKMYVDKTDGTVEQIGWVFEKRMRYEDARGNGPDDYYTRHAWVRVSLNPPVVTTTEELVSPWATRETMGA